MDSPLKLKLEPQYDPAVLLLGIYPDNIIIQKDTCTPMFIAVLFTAARTLKQPRWPSANEWIKKILRYKVMLLSCKKKKNWVILVM